MRINYESNLKIKQEDIAKLIDMPVVITVNKFDEDSAKAFSTEFSKALNNEQPVIPILIDSYGGYVDSLFNMIDVCRSNKIKPISTIVVGKAMSCGAVLTTCGWHGYRYAAPLSRIMIHDVSSSSWGKTEDIKADANESIRLNDVLYNIMESNCQRESKYFWNIVQDRGRADWYMTAEEARRHNIINHIGIPSIQVKLNVEYGFGV
jgi:ATP-dependent Clp endopeptidase proteolytic subunit ClpP